MNLYVLDEQFNPIKLIEEYESLIWATRYKTCGDFELYLTITSPEVLNYFKRGYYIARSDVDSLMIIEQLTTETDTDDENHLSITGRSLESIPERRIVWGSKSITGNLQDGIISLFNDNLINPSDPNRKINNYKFIVSDDPNIISMTMDAQYTGDDLYSILTNVCEERNMGFKTILNSDNEFVTSLYCGKDRTLDQLVYPAVVFSPMYENLDTSSFVQNSKGYKNVTLIGGEGDAGNRKYVPYGEEHGLNRREVYTDASGTTSNVNNRRLTDEEYTALLIQKGKEKLAESPDIEAFEGTVLPTASYEFGKDYYLGDLVTVINEYGITANARVIEAVESFDSNGYSLIPTFEYNNQ